MKSILLITGNRTKLSHARHVLEPLGIHVEHAELDIPEIQSADPIKIAEAKAQSAYERIRQPLIVEDYSWAFTALNGFPGAYMKDVTAWLSADDFLALMRDKQDRSVKLTDTLVYYDGRRIKLFQQVFEAQVAEAARGRGNVTVDQVIIFAGETETIAQKVDKGQHSRDLSDSSWTQFGKWYLSVTEKKKGLKSANFKE